MVLLLSSGSAVSGGAFTHEHTHTHTPGARWAVAAPVQTSNSSKRVCRLVQVRETTPGEETAAFHICLPACSRILNLCQYWFLSAERGTSPELCCFRWSHLPLSSSTVGERERAAPSHDGPPAHAPVGAKAFQPTSEFTLQIHDTV